MASDKFITLQPGKYILGFKAHTVCKNDIYIDVSIDTKEFLFLNYEKNINIPVCVTADGTYTRSIKNVLPAKFDKPIELHFLCYTSAIITITYELWAIKL